MDSLPVALSVHHFVSSVGADAGFAAFIAVAILVLLYFAHARETATLRTRADEAAARVEDLEAQVAQLTDQVAALPPEISVRATSPRAAAAYGGVPGRAVVGMPATAGAGAGTLPPAAPAGMAAPALAAATRLIPDPDSYAREPAPATAGGSNGAGHRPVAAPAAAAATVQRPVGAPAGATDGAARAGAPGQGGSPGPGGPGRAQGYGRPPSGGGQRPGGPTRPQGAPMRPPPRRPVGRLLLGAAVAVLGLAAVAAAVVVLTNRGGSSSAHRSTASLTSQPVRHANVIAVRPSTVTVSVLNGTDRVGLAGDISQRLAADGYRKGAVTNFSDQTQTTSVVAYMTPADRPDALAVASSLKLSRSLVQLIDQNTKAIACPPSQACTSQVVVTIGHDLAQ